jgi:predicted nuclease of predicted toxin-antitoxin system
MIFWFDAQLSPQLAPWLAQRFGVTAHAVRDLGLRDATDRAIYDAARAAGVVAVARRPRHMARCACWLRCLCRSHTAHPWLR